MSSFSLKEIDKTEIYSHLILSLSKYMTSKLVLYPTYIRKTQ